MRRLWMLVTVATGTTVMVAGCSAAHADPDISGTWQLIRAGTAGPTTAVPRGAWITIDESHLSGFDGLNHFTADLAQQGTTLTLSNYTASAVGTTRPDPRIDTMNALFTRPSIKATLTNGHLDLSSDRTHAAFTTRTP